MKLPYIASDLDGTIVQNHNFEILEQTVKDIIEYQKKSNNNFFIVTGRATSNMKFYIEQLNITLPVISANGAAITDPITQEIYFQHIMDVEMVVNLLNHAIKNNLEVSLYTANSLCALKNSERIKTYDKLYGNYPKKYQPDYQLYDDYFQLIEDVVSKKLSPIKLMYSLDEKNDIQKYHNLMKYLENENLYHPATFIQSRIIVDAMPLGINKLFGVKKWAEIMNVNFNDIHTIGDNNNDIEMVGESKNGIAVGNSVENLKKVASKVIDSIEKNGVGKYLKELINEKE